ncbi:hypothetical protein ACFX10_027948 [Malus domestica]
MGLDQEPQKHCGNHGSESHRAEDDHHHDRETDGHGNHQYRDSHDSRHHHCCETHHVEDDHPHVRNGQSHDRRRDQKRNDHERQKSHGRLPKPRR